MILRFRPAALIYLMGGLYWLLYQCGLAGHDSPALASCIILLQAAGLILSVWGATTFLWQVRRGVLRRAGLTLGLTLAVLGGCGALAQKSSTYCRAHHAADLYDALDGTPIDFDWDEIYNNYFVAYFASPFAAGALIGFPVGFVCSLPFVRPARGRRNPPAGRP